MKRKILNVICAMLMVFALVPVFAYEKALNPEDIQLSATQLSEIINQNELKQIVLPAIESAKDKKPIAATPLSDVMQLGGGDEAWVSYYNNYIRFVKGENGAQSYWFYAYIKEAYEEKYGYPEEVYNRLPNEVFVRVYEGNQENALAEKYELQQSGPTYISNDGMFTPFRFQSENDTWGHAGFTFWKKNATVILSAPNCDGSALTYLEKVYSDNPFPENEYGKDDERLNAIAKAITIL